MVFTLLTVIQLQITRTELLFKVLKHDTNLRSLCRVQKCDKYSESFEWLEFFQSIEALTQYFCENERKASFHLVFLLLHLKKMRLRYKL